MSRSPRLVAALTVAQILVTTLVYAQQTDVVFKDDVTQYVTVGDKTKDVKVTLTIGAESLTVARSEKDVTVIPFSAITRTRGAMRGWCVLARTDLCFQ